MKMKLTGERESYEKLFSETENSLGKKLNFTKANTLPFFNVTYMLQEWQSFACWWPYPVYEEF